MPRNVFNREEPFTIARAGQGSGKYSISFPFRRRVSFSVIVSCHVEDTSCEMPVGELHAGALGSLVFSWVVPMSCTWTGWELDWCPSYHFSRQRGAECSSVTWERLPRRGLALPLASGLAVHTCTYGARLLQCQNNYPQAGIWHCEPRSSGVALWLGFAALFINMFSCSGVEAEQSMYLNQPWLWLSCVLAAGFAFWAVFCRALTCGDCWIAGSLWRGGHKSFL